MSLAPSERQALARIEDALRSSDPRLAAALATFTMPAAAGPAPRGKYLRWTWLSPWRRWLRHHLCAVLALATASALITIIALFTHTSHAHTTPSQSCGTAISQTAGCHQPAPLSR